MHAIFVVPCSEDHHWLLTRLPFSGYQIITKPRAEFSGNMRLLRREGECREVHMRGGL